MTEKLLKIIEKKYPLTRKDSLNGLKVGPMRFDLVSYTAEGLGHVSVMRAKGMLGLMRMDTLMINPIGVELPLYSYDRIFAMGNDTLIVELYNTLSSDSFAMKDVKREYTDLTERDPGEHWYDSIKLKESISKKGKKAHTKRLDELAVRHLEAYFEGASPTADEEIKREKARTYVEGLLTKGGPSTDAFKKALGEDKTREIFHSILFGTK